MKYRFMIVLMLILLCLTSCDANSLSQEESESWDDLSCSISPESSDNDVSYDNNVATESYTTIAGIYDPYYLLNPTDPFVLSMQNNPVDQWASSIMQGRLTTKDLQDGLLLIYEQWKSELSATEHVLLTALDDTELEDAFLDYQNAWAEYVETDIRFDKSVITAEYWTTEFQLVFLERRIELYRSRVIQLKYLIYMNCMNSDEEIDLDALWFTNAD